MLGMLVVVLWPQIQSLFQGFFPAYARVQVVDADGQLLRRVHMEMFALVDKPYDPSPSPKVGEGDFEADASGVFTLGPEHIPMLGFVLIHAPGHGVGYRQLKRGRKNIHEIRLGRPMAVSGSVTNKTGDPIPNARVLALSGDSRGVLLSEVHSEPDGTFVIAGLSARLQVMHVRVLCDGYGMRERRWWNEVKNRSGSAPLIQNLDFELMPVPPATGRVVLPEGVSAADLELRIYNLPGVSCRLADDGAFTLHHLQQPEVDTFSVLVANLPPGYTHPYVLVRPGDKDVEIPVRKAVTLNGRLLHRQAESPLPGATITHRCGTRGGGMAEVGSDGSFRFEGLPPGQVRLEISLPKSKLYPDGGLRRKLVELKEGSDQKPVVVWVW